MQVSDAQLTKLRTLGLANINMGMKRTHTIQLDYSDIDPAFTGAISFHYPSQLESIRIGVIKSGLTGGLEVDIATNNTAHILSTLEVVIDNKPEWFTVDDPRIDYAILEEVYMQYLNWTNTFRRKPE